MRREFRAPILSDYLAAIQLFCEADRIIIRFRKTQAPLDARTDPSDLELDTLPPFGSSVSEATIVSAIDFILARDSSLRDLFLEGSCIQKSILGRNPINELKRSSRLHLDDYRRMRPTLEDLVRPMFLSPPDLKELRSFQRQGVEWLLENTRGILADDMGLGKTVQTISAMRISINSGVLTYVLLVCPKSLLANWEAELGKWAPELTFVRVIPEGKARKEIWNTVTNRFHILITNYEQLRLLSSSIPVPSIDLVVADEAHRIRNMGSSVNKGMRQIESRWFWALTGTPIERDAEDLATLLSIVDPYRFSSKDRSLNIHSLRARAKPYILRRKKADVLDDLPEVMEIEERIELLPKQRLSYRRVANSIKDRDDLSVLSVINQLRTICDYDTESEESAKLDRIMEIIRDINLAGEKVVVFSMLLRPLELLLERLHTELSQESAVFLKGDMAHIARDECISRFRSEERISVLLASMKVGGEGLTLTEANNVIFVNQWWNPSSNMQAQDRVVRIGQKRGVRIYKFTCTNTVEEHLETILREKRKVSFELIDRLADPTKVYGEAKELLQELRQSVEQYCRESCRD